MRRLWLKPQNHRDPKQSERTWAAALGWGGTLESQTGPHGRKKSGSPAISTLPGTVRGLPRWTILLGALFLVVFSVVFSLSEMSRSLLSDGLAAWAGVVAVVLLLVALLVRAPSRRRQIGERLNRATSQLRSDRLDLRLDAIHVLEGIARERVDFHWSAMETLTAFIRENAGWRGNEEESLGESPMVRSDIEMALTAVGARKWLEDEQERGVRLGLANTNLRKAALVNAHLERADLHDAHLEYAEFWRAHLESANLSGAHLEDANLSQVHLEHANLEKAHLAGANLQFGSLQGANLRGADLTGVRLTLAHLEGADLSDATGLTRTQLREAYRDRGTKLPEYIEDPIS